MDNNTITAPAFLYALHTTAKQLTNDKSKYYAPTVVQRSKSRVVSSTPINRQLIISRLDMTVTVYIRISDPPGPIFHAQYLHSSSWNCADAKKVCVANNLARAFRRRVARYWHYWHPLGCRVLELGKTPQGGGIYTTCSSRIRYFRAVKCDILRVCI